MANAPLANPLKGEAELVLGDGRQFTLRFDFDALCSAQKASGLPFGKMAAELGEGASMETMLGLLRGGLKGHHPDVGEEDAKAMLVGDFQACMEAIGEGMTSAMGRRRRRGGPSDGANGPESWDFDALLESWVEAGLDPDIFGRQSPRMFTAALKGAGKRVIVEAHFAEYLAREKKLKPVDHYLKPKAKSVASGTAVATGLKQMEKRGLAVKVKRIASPKAAPQSKD